MVRKASFAAAAEELGAAPAYMSKRIQLLKRWVDTATEGMDIDERVGDDMAPGGVSAGDICVFTCITPQVSFDMSIFE